MEKKNVFEQIGDLTGQVGHVHEVLVSLQRQVAALLEDNKRLSIENAQLRKLMRNDSNREAQEEGQLTSSVGEGYDNLTRLYHEGFHICNVYYGHLRTEGDCLFCLAFLNK